MSINKTRAIFFDLDGTLVDSAADLATSVNHALATIGKPALSEATLRSYIGNGAERLIHRAITLDYEGEAETSLYAPVRAHFLQHYAANVCIQSTLYPEVKEVLVSLTDQHYSLACITNKPKQFTQPLLEALGVDDFFSLVLCGDSLARKKPAPDQLRYAAEHFSFEPAECLMIGDTNTDISAALNCEMPAIFVTYGYGELADLDARFNGPQIDHMHKLHEYL